MGAYDVCLSQEPFVLDGYGYLFYNMLSRKPIR